MHAPLYTTKQAGFTLVEMIVALAVFTFVMLISIGALLALSNSAQKTQAIRNLTDNLDFAVEGMARTMRVGTSYHCGESLTPAAPADCAGGQNAISFYDSIGRWIVYRLNTSNNTIERSIGGSSYVSMTAPEIKVTTLQFYVVGSLLNDGQQPKVVLIVRALSGAKLQVVTTFNIQTTVTQRLIDS